MSNPNNGAENGNGIQALAYVNFFIEKKYRVDEIAARMGIAPDTLYKYIRGENTWPAERIPDLHNATNDFHYMSYLAERCSCIVVPKPKSKAVDQDIRQLGLSISIAVGELQRAVEKAMDNGSIPPKEFKKISVAVTDVEQRCETLKEAIKAQVSK